MNEQTVIVSIFDSGEKFVEAVKGMRESGIRDFEVYSPAGVLELEPWLAKRGSPIRLVVYTAGAVGLAGGFALAIGSALLYSLIVGGKFPVSWLPYCIVGFEAAVLVGGLTALGAIIGFARLRPERPVLTRDPRFQEDRFGIAVPCPPEQTDSVIRLLKQAGAEEVHEQR